MLDIDLARPYRVPSSRFRKVAIVLGILLGILVLGVLLLEVASRMADGVVERRKADPAYDPKPHEPGGKARDWADALALDTLDPAALRLQDLRTLPHPYLGYALKPSWSTPAGASQQCSHNSLGFRGKETTWAKPAGVFRIVTSGGSSVYGQSETRDAAVWSQKLEEFLNEAGLGFRVEVINGGAPGYSSFESLIHFQLRLLDCAPDLLLHYEAINDVRTALYTRGGDVAHDNTHWRTAWPVDRPSALERALEKYRAYLVWRCYATDYVRLRSDLGYWAIRNYDQTGDPYDPEPVPDLGFATYRRNLVDLIAAARAHGVKVLLVTQPLARYHLDGAPSQGKQLAGIDRVQGIEREVGRELGVPVYELAREMDVLVQEELDREVARQKGLDPATSDDLALRRAKGTLHPSPLPKVPLENVLFRHDVHPYDHGSAVIARKIADYLLASDLLR